MDRKELHKTESLAAFASAEEDYDLLVGMIEQMLVLFDQLQSVVTDLPSSEELQITAEPRGDVAKVDSAVEDILSRFSENEDRYVVLPAVL